MPSCRCVDCHSPESLYFLLFCFPGLQKVSADMYIVACQAAADTFCVQGHRLGGTEQGAAPQGDVSGSPRYGAPVTTGHDKQQLSAQAHGASDRLNVSSAQVLPLPIFSTIFASSCLQGNTKSVFPTCCSLACR